MNCNGLKHRIGEGSSYDGDMDLIESYVKYANNPTDELLIAELRAYYMSRALHFWQQLKEFLHEGNEMGQEDMFNHVKNSNKIILENIDYYEKIFFDILNDLNNDFNIIKCTKLFIYIGMLNCFNSETTLDKLYSRFFSRNIDFNRLFPLVNDNGVFSLNTWLYAFFEKIELAGFTSKSSEFDGNIGCSLDMFEHDLDHLIESVKINPHDQSNQMDKESDEFYTLKCIYYNIINSEFLSRDQKELDILILWIIIHEYIFNINFNDPVEKSLQNFVTWSYDDIAGKYSVSEFVKYSYLLLTQENIQNTLYYFQNLKLNNSCYKTSQFQYELDLDNLLNSLPFNKIQNTEELSDYNYMFLGIVNFFEEIKNNYDYYTRPINFTC